MGVERANVRRTVMETCVAELDDGRGLAHELAESAVNEVRLVGRVSRDPLRRLLPGGGELWTFRVVVPRVTSARRGLAPRALVEALDCSVWTGRVQRQVRTVRAGDVIEVRGSIRKRFVPSPRRTDPRVEIEVTGVTKTRVE
jgi:single-strand DNA-binding protein